MTGMASLSFMSFFEMFRQFLTATARLRNLYFSITFLSSDSCDTKTRQLCESEDGMAPYMGRP